MVSQNQLDSIARLSATLDAGRIPDRSKSFAADLVRKGAKRNLSSKQMYWVEKLATDNTEEAVAVKEASTDSRMTAMKAIPAIKNNYFAKSLIEQYERKGSLSEKQWPHVERFIKEAADRVARRAEDEKKRKEHERKILPVASLDGYEPVEEMFQAALDNLKKPEWTLVHGPEHRTFLVSYDKDNSRILVGYSSRPYGYIKDGTFTYTTYATEAKTLLPLMEDFKHDPTAVAAESGHLRGKCTFCAKDLKTENSTSHGYGPVCAKRYGLVWNVASAREIQAIRAARVAHVVIETHAEGWQVVDAEDGSVLATFKTSAEARAYADEFSTIKVII